MKRSKILLAVVCLVLGLLASISAVRAASKADYDDPEYYKYNGMDGGEAIADETDGMITPYAASGANPYTGNVYTHDPKKKDMRVVYGVDVSKWQKNVDWKKVKAAGIDYAFIRAGYSSLSSGNHMKDEYFDQNMKNARAAGIKVGVYYYSQATTEEEARSEAQYLLGLIKGYTLDYPVVFDAEEGTYTDNGKTVPGKLAAVSQKLSESERIKLYNSAAIAFCDTVRAAGYTPMIYGSITHFLDKMDAKALSEKYMMWIARYNTVLNNSKYTYDGNYQFWQYTSTGKVSGINGSTDCNFLYLSGNEDTDWKQGGSGWSESEDVSPTNPGMGGISGFSVKAAGRDTINLSWNTNSQAAYYDIYRADAYNGTYKKLSTTQQTSFSDADCAEGREYYYYVIPIGKDSSLGKKSSVKRAYTSSDTKVYVKTWNGSLNMRKEADAGSSVVAVIPKNTKVYRYCESRSSGGVVWYKVKYKKSGVIYKGYVSSSYATVVVNKLPKVKQSSKTKTSISLSWGKQSGVTGYQIYRSTARNGKFTKLTTIKDLNTKSYQDTGLKSNREYWYKLRAYSKVNGKTTYGTSVLLRATTKTTSSKVRIKKSTKLYQYAGTSYKTVVSIPKNTKVTVTNAALDKKGATWYRVKYKKGKKTYYAYIKKSLTKKA